jgi:dTDP-L-rhamnose 4-epimerase
VDVVLLGQRARQAQVPHRPAPVERQGKLVRYREDLHAHRRVHAYRRATRKPAPEATLVRLKDDAMTNQTVLVTGGAGFIGSHLVDRLVEAGRRVRVLDALEPQVHGGSGGYRNAGAEYLEGTVLDRELVRSALGGVEAVVHLAAQVGVGQSMYEMERYVRENCVGTAVLLEELAERRDALSALVVASSMSIYGEGQYVCDGCGDPDPEVVRTEEALRDRRWDPVCVRCGEPVRPVPTTERKRLRSDSVYAATKRDQEDLCLVAGRAYGIRTVALRFFNTYGTRQALSNPYTGAAAIFSSRLLNGNPPLVFEDGLQSRDFVHVSDIVQGVELALERGDADGVALNVGTGRSTTVLDVARTLAKAMDSDVEPEIVNRFRHGDIRHCFADISAARAALGYEPRVTLEDGMRELCKWIAEEAPRADDRVAASTAELEERGLVI